MCVIIAIPEPTSLDAAYNQRALPEYLTALRAAGATPLVVPLHERQDRVARLLMRTQGVLLPGSRYDVDPQRYGETPIPECGPADPARTAVDELLLQDAFNLKKPILAICHGMQTLNVWCNGSLIQDLKTTVNHRPGREVIEAHRVRITAGSRLGRLLQGVRIEGSRNAEVHVNSSHHQAVREAGEPLRVTAISPQDGVVEAVELESADHFVVGVQWHPERTYTVDAFSRGVFSVLVQAASAWKEPQVELSVASENSSGHRIHG
jgi:putative glutamine amidotransferase